METGTKIILNIFGPSTVGKSTIAEKLQSHIDQLYTVDFDVVKRQIQGYHWQRDGGVATEITYDTLVSVAKTDLPILALLPPPKQKETYDRIAEIAATSGRTLVNIEIVAPETILIQRYEDRLQQVRESGSNWKFKTLDEFKAGLQQGYYRPEDTHTFDSSLLSPDEIFSDVEELLKNL